MRLNNIGYLLKEGFRGIFLRGFMSFAAVCVTVASLLIVGSFASLMYNVNLMVDDLNKTNEVLVFVDETYSVTEARHVETIIRQMENIHEAVFVSRETALENFIADHDGDEAFAAVEPSDLRHRIRVILEDNSLLEQTTAELQDIPGVVKIRAEYELAEGFATIQQVLEVITLAIAVVLLIVSLLIISNTVKLAMYDRRDEIAIMKMVGATNGFIRLPFVVEGFFLGMIGAAVAFAMEWVLYDALVLKIEAMDTLKLFSFVPFDELLIPMVITFGAAGLFVGVVGSWTSIRKFMDV